MKRYALTAAMLGFLTFSAVSQATEKGHTSMLDHLPGQVFAGQKSAIYLNVPSADSGLSNLMIRAFAGDALWMRQLTDIMSRGAQSPTYLIVGSRSDGVAYSATRKALASFKGKSLPQLHLALVGDPKKAEKLRSMVEALGAEYQVVPSSPGT